MWTLCLNHIKIWFDKKKLHHRWGKASSLLLWLKLRSKTKTSKHVPITVRDWWSDLLTRLLNNCAAGVEECSLKKKVLAYQIKFTFYPFLLLSMKIYYQWLSLDWICILVNLNSVLIEPFVSCSESYIWLWYILTIYWGTFISDLYNYLMWLRIKDQCWHHIFLEHPKWWCGWFLNQLGY